MVLCKSLCFTWDDDNYYVIAYYECYEDIINFRVDRMEGVETLNLERKVIIDGVEIDVAEYTKKFLEYLVVLLRGLSFNLTTH